MVKRTERLPVGKVRFVPAGTYVAKLTVTFLKSEPFFKVSAIPAQVAGKSERMPLRAAAFEKPLSAAPQKARRTRIDGIFTITLPDWWKMVIGCWM